MSEENEPISAKDESKDIWVKFWLICFWVGVAIFINEIGLVGYTASKFVCPREPVKVLAKVRASDLGSDWRLKLDANYLYVKQCQIPIGWGSCHLGGPDEEFTVLHRRIWSYWRFTASEMEIRYRPNNRVLFNKFSFNEDPPWLINAVLGGVGSSSNLCSSSIVPKNNDFPLTLLIDSEK